MTELLGPRANTVPDSLSGIVPVAGNAEQSGWLTDAHPLMVAWAWSAGAERQDAEDIAQETATRVLGRQIIAANGRNSVLSYLSITMRSVVTDIHRRQAMVERVLGSRTVFEVEVIEDETSRRTDSQPVFKSPEDSLILQETRTEILEALHHLAPRERLIVQLRILDGLSVAETARVADITDGTVKSTLSRGLAHLRPYIQAIVTDNGVI